jgi:hypothetical protein
MVLASFMHARTCARFLFLAGLLSLTSTVSHAAYTENPGQLSSALIQKCNNRWYAAKNPLSCALAVYDPPAGILQFGLELHYNPAVLTIVEGGSGFLCDFTEDGDCPTTGPAVFEPFDGSVVNAGGPRTGTTFSLDVMSNTVLLNYDMTGNPALMTQERNVFGLVVLANGPITGVTFHYTPGVGDLYQVIGPNSYCTSTDLTSCGSSNPVLGMTFHVVPEPGTWFLISSALALGLTAKFRRG